jgi:hypothetical protein
MSVLWPGDDKYESQVSQDDSSTIDITAIWNEAGRPEHCSPWAWAEQAASHSDSGPFFASGDERDDPVILPRDVALKYARSLDSLNLSLELLAGLKLIRADPAGCLIRRPESTLSMWVLPMVARARGVGIEEAAELIVAEVVERTADLDPFAQETVVAKVQRDVREVPGLVVFLCTARSRPRADSFAAERSSGGNLRAVKALCLPLAMRLTRPSAR